MKLLFAICVKTVIKKVTNWFSCVSDNFLPVLGRGTTCSTLEITRCHENFRHSLKTKYTDCNHPLTCSEKASLTMSRRQYQLGSRRNSRFSCNSCHHVTYEFCQRTCSMVILSRAVELSRFSFFVCFSVYS